MKCFLFFALTFFATVAQGAPALADLESAISQEQWSEAAEISHEILVRDPKNAAAKAKGAYALFQLGYNSAALLFIKKLSPAEWSALPQGKDRFVEIVALFQKRVPLSLLPGQLAEVRPEDSSAYLRDELFFARGKVAFIKKDYDSARKFLAAIGKSSRYSGQAHYLLGSIAVKLDNYREAGEEFSRIFEPSVFDQSAEFWTDMSTQTTSHWGANLKVLLDSKVLTQSQNLGELALLGLARVSYAMRDYELALSRYRKLPSSSKWLPRAQLERIWALLALNRHEEAQKEAQNLAVSEKTFESIVAKPQRALILTDAKKTAEARAEIDSFEATYREVKKK